MLRGTTPEGSSPPNAKVIRAFFNQPKTTDDAATQREREKFKENVNKGLKKVQAERIAQRL